MHGFVQGSTLYTFVLQLLLTFTIPTLFPPIILYPMCLAPVLRYICSSLTDPCQQRGIKAKEENAKIHLLLYGVDSDGQIVTELSE